MIDDLEMDLPKDSFSEPKSFFVKDDALVTQEQNELELKIALMEESGDKQLTDEEVCRRIEELGGCGFSVNEILDMHPEIIKYKNRLEISYLRERGKLKIKEDLVKTSYAQARQDSKMMIMLVEGLFRK